FAFCCLPDPGFAPDFGCVADFGCLATAWACDPPPQPASRTSATSAALSRRLHFSGLPAVGAPTRNHLLEAAHAEDEDERAEADRECERGDRDLLPDRVGGCAAA